MPSAVFDRIALWILSFSFFPFADKNDKKGKGAESVIRN